MDLQTKVKYSRSFVYSCIHWLMYSFILVVFNSFTFILFVFNSPRISDLADQTNQIIYNAMLEPMRQTLKVKVNDVVAYKKTDLNYDVIADEAEKSSK